MNTQFKTQQSKSEDYSVFSLHLLKQSLFLNTTSRKLLAFIHEKLKRLLSFLILSRLFLVLCNKVSQLQIIPGRKFCSFWILCKKHMVLWQKSPEFWNQKSKSLGNRTSARHISDRPFASFHHTLSDLSSHLTWTCSHNAHIHPFSSSRSSPRWCS